MNTNLNLGLNKVNNPTGLSNQEIIQNWVLYALNQKYGQALKGQTLRSVNRLMNKLQKAVDDNAEKVELEESEKDIIREVFGEEIGFPVGAAPVVVAIQNEIASWAK